MAGELLRASLRARVAHGDGPRAAGCLLGLALVAADDGQPDRAARLLAAEVALLFGGTGPASPRDRADREVVLASCRAALGEAAFAAAWKPARPCRWSRPRRSRWRKAGPRLPGGRGRASAPWPSHGWGSRARTGITWASRGAHHERRLMPSLLSLVGGQAMSLDDVVACALVEAGP